MTCWRQPASGVVRLAVVGGRFLREPSWPPAIRAFSAGVCFATCFSLFCGDTVECEPSASTDTWEAIACRLARVDPGTFGIRICEAIAGIPPPFSLAPPGFPVSAPPHQPYLATSS